MLEVQLDHRYCPTCETEQLFEAPLCQDGHGESCPDLACVVCGMALFVVMITEDGTHLTPRHPATTRRTA